MSPAAEACLRSFATLIKNEREAPPSEQEMRDLLAEADACLTGWGVRIPEAALDNASRLQIIAHMGGSVKSVVPPVVYERGTVVTHAAGSSPSQWLRWRFFTDLEPRYRVTEAKRASMA